MATKRTAPRSTPKPAAKSARRAAAEAPQTPSKTPVQAAAKAAKSKPAPVPAKADAAKPPAAASAKTTAAETPKVKHKLVRDSFTIPKSEYGVLEALKVRATNLKRPTKKSEMLRAGIAALNAMSDKAFLSTLNGVPSLKTGRPVNVPPLNKAAHSGDAL